jgi:hypothetical protein
MRFLINNYSSNFTTEPFYLNAGLNLLSSCKAAMWNQTEISAYDIFDQFQPDYFITDAKNISLHAVDYILRNKHKNIKTLINISGMTQDYVNAIDSKLTENGVEVPFYFTNNDSSKIKALKTKIIYIGLGADIFLRPGNLNFKIDRGIIINSESAIKNYEYPYPQHFISVREELSNIADIVLPTFQLSNIYHNYKEIIFRDIYTVVPQMFYDAVYSGNKVYFDIDHHEKGVEFSEKLKKVLKIELDVCDPNLNSAELKSVIKKKHTCLNRLKSLLSQLPCADSLKNIENIIGERL